MEHYAPLIAPLALLTGQLPNVPNSTTLRLFIANQQTLYESDSSRRADHDARTTLYSAATLFWSARAKVNKGKGSSKFATSNDNQIAKGKSPNPSGYST